MAHVKLAQATALLKAKAPVAFRLNTGHVFPAGRVKEITKEGKTIMTDKVSPDGKLMVFKWRHACGHYSLLDARGAVLERLDEGKKKPKSKAKKKVAARPAPAAAEASANA